MSNEDMLKKIFNNKDGIHFENGNFSLINLISIK